MSSVEGWRWAATSFKKRAMALMGERRERMRTTTAWGGVVDWGRAVRVARMVALAPG